MRAPPDEQLSNSTSGCRRRSSSSSRYSASVCSCVPARPLAPVACTWSRFMSHLTNAMSWSPSSASSRPRISSKAAGIGEVEDQLVAAEHRFVAGVGERPVGMGPVQVAVRVDHLRLDPDAEFHAEGAHSLDQRRQPLGMGIGGDPPVAEPGGVVTAPAEPTVVEHEALDADRRGALGESGERVEVVIEVHRLPRVEHDGSRSVAMGGRRAHDGVELPARRTEASRRVDRVHRRGPIALAGPQHDLAGMQQLAELDHRPPVGQASGVEARVAAPRQVNAPHLAVLLAEAGGAGPQQRRVLVRGAAAPVLRQERTVVERPPARMELAAPPPVERQQLGDVRRQRQGDRQVVDPVVVVALVDQLGREDDRPAGVAIHRGDESEGGDARRWTRSSRCRRRRPSTRH